MISYVTHAHCDSPAEGFLPFCRFHFNVHVYPVHSVCGLLAPFVVLYFTTYYESILYFVVACSPSSSGSAEFGTIMRCSSGENPFRYTAVYSAHYYC